MSDERSKFEFKIKKEYALIVAVSRRREEQVSTTFKNLERLWDEYDVYERVE